MHVGPEVKYSLKIVMLSILNIFCIFRIHEAEGLLKVSCRHFPKGEEFLPSLLFTNYVKIMDGIEISFILYDKTVDVIL